MFGITASPLMPTSDCPKLISVSPLIDVESVGGESRCAPGPDARGETAVNRAVAVQPRNSVTRVPWRSGVHIRECAADKKRLSGSANRVGVGTAKGGVLRN